MGRSNTKASLTFPICLGAAELKRFREVLNRNTALFALGARQATSTEVKRYMMWAMMEETAREFGFTCSIAEGIVVALTNAALEGVVDSITQLHYYANGEYLVSF